MGRTISVKDKDPEKYIRYSVPEPIFRYIIQLECAIINNDYENLIKLYKWVFNSFVFAFITKVP